MNYFLNPWKVLDDTGNFVDFRKFSNRSHRFIYSKLILQQKQAMLQEMMTTSLISKHNYLTVIEWSKLHWDICNIKSFTSVMGNNLKGICPSEKSGEFF